eukprot:COSAG01_NODE_49700_length_369_cov_27.248148_1_plen_44_part_10
MGPTIHVATAAVQMYGTVVSPYAAAAPRACGLAAWPALPPLCTA